MWADIGPDVDHPPRSWAAACVGLSFEKRIASMPPEGQTSRRRKPRGYLGKSHETIGSDILAVLQILKMPEQVLGIDEVRRLAEVEVDGWYPIEWLLDLMEKVDKELGHYGLLQLGRRLFAMSHEERLIQVARSAADVIYG